jgi:GrpB-like predicted nucleotidyltransferase (UPF0157 family)
MQPAPRPIEVVPYDPRWPEAFAVEAPRLKDAIGENVVAIHHVGSTAVPGLCAKPIIDILVEVNDIEAVDAQNERMRQLGYEVRGEWGFSGRRYFVKREGSRRTHHVHVYQTGHPEIESACAFRDYLRAHPAQAREYGCLKQRLAQQSRLAGQGYQEAKAGFVERMVKAALAWRRGAD